MSELPERPIVVRLSGWAQHNDRLAMREIAYQLTQQTGTSFRTTDEEEAEVSDEEGQGLGKAELAEMEG